jgi:protein TonB
MLRTLIESRRTAKRSPGGAAASVMVHAALIVLAVAMTAHAKVPEPPAPKRPDLIYIPVAEPVPPRPAPHDSRTTQSESGTLPAPPEHPPIIPPIGIPTELPPIDPTRPAIDPGDYVGAVNAHGITDGLAEHGGTGGPGGTYTWLRVEKQTQPVQGNPKPVYPSMLESARVDGEVLAQFVVDTAGRADMSTFKVLEATNELFVDAVKRVLPTWHFYPAETGGHKVKQLVQMRFTFTVP